MALILFCSQFGLARAVVYVDWDSSGGDGSSWEEAYQTLEAAISGSTEYQEFWVAEGTYTPTSTLFPEEGSAFYGGFSGRESDRSERSISGNTTIISGVSSGQRPIIIWNDNPNVRIDGFTITDGVATTSGISWDGYGGAIFVDQVWSEIANCIFMYNSATTYGGAVFINRNASMIENCTFENNSSQSGGAIAGYESGITVFGCGFYNNRADQGTVSERRGGAIWLHKEDSQIVYSIFSGNTAHHSGGAVELNNTPYGLVSGCTFEGNETGIAGGGLSVQWDESSPRPSVDVVGCRFQGNSSGLEGGGLYARYCYVEICETDFHGNNGLRGGGVMLDYQHPQDGPSQVDRCRFVANSGTTIGGGFYAFQRSVQIDNSVFAYNLASKGNGGGIGMNNHDGVSSVTALIRNCTVSGNSAVAFHGYPVDGYGGGMMNSFVDMVYLYNCVFWGNHGETQIWDAELPDFVDTDDIFNANSSHLTTRYTDMETLDWNHASVSESHTGSFSEDPLFVDPDGDDNIEGTWDDNFRLQSGSTCIDHADGNYAPELDIEFHARVDISDVINQGTGTPDYADVGAYERTVEDTPRVGISPGILMLLLEN